MSETNISKRMRDDWNKRAREDANFYVAFGRRGQDASEFFDTAREVVLGLREELKRLPPADPRSRRALEIGCGPGRIIKHIHSWFGEIHGVDVSDEMIAMARQNLEGIPHAHVHATNGSKLDQFASDSFDFIYSYAVFQHIPSKEVVFSYLEEAHRVLKPGGIIRCQMNSLPPAGKDADTWSGISIRGEEAAMFAWNHDLQLLALEGAGTQYMWLTLRKRPEGWRHSLDALAESKPPAGIRRLTNSESSEPLAPNRGRFSCVSLWVEDLDDEADLNGIQVLIGGRPAVATYIGVLRPDGLRQLSAVLPPGLETGLQSVELLWMNRRASNQVLLRVIPPGPPVPRITAVTDGVNYLSGARILTGSVKLTIEDAWNIDEFAASVEGQPVEHVETLCTDARVARYEVNFRLPARLGPGSKKLYPKLGRRALAPIDLEIATT